MNDEATTQLVAGANRQGYLQLRGRSAETKTPPIAATPHGTKASSTPNAARPASERVTHSGSAVYRWEKSRRSMASAYAANSRDIRNFASFSVDPPTPALPAFRGKQAP